LFDAISVSVTISIGAGILEPSIAQVLLRNRWVSHIEREFHSGLDVRNIESAWWY
jgi:hypothetical protein